MLLSFPPLFPGALGCLLELQLQCTAARLGSGRWKVVPEGPSLDSFSVSSEDTKVAGVQCLIELFSGDKIIQTALEAR